MKSNPHRHSLPASSRIRLFTVLLVGTVATMPEPAHATEPESASGDVRYVAPDRQGDGSGDAPHNAAFYLDDTLWEEVSEALEKEPVTVRFADGHYREDTLILQRIGHHENRLVLEPATAGGAVFDGDLRWQIRLRGARNTTLRHLHFTGPTRNFALHIRSERDYPAHDLTVEHCRFVDLDKATYGAIGISGEVTELVIRDNIFQRVGYSAHAHMIYTTYGGFGPGPLRFLNNHFEDSFGDYLRLRNRIGHAEISGNTFFSTSVARNRPFIAMPVFNTEAPGTEVISDDVLIRGNTFRYHPWEEQDWDRGIAICLSSYGYDPGDRRYLLSPEQADHLRSGPLEESRALLENTLGINPRTIRLADNLFENAFHRVGFGAFAHFGAESRGWEGFIDITRLVSHED